MAFFHGKTFNFRPAVGEERLRDEPKECLRRRLAITLVWYVLKQLFTSVSVKSGGNGVRPRGGGGTPLYELYRYVRPQRVLFFSRFGHK